MKVVIITGDEDRHKFFRRFLNSHRKIKKIFAIVERSSDSQTAKIFKEKKNKKFEHFKEREMYEKKFFHKYLKNYKDIKDKVIIKKGILNSNEKLINKIIKMKADIIFSYGCSLIKNKLIKIYRGKFVNLHLGLSPYYRGSGTNFWPLVNNEPQFLGATFMFIDEGIDTGEIVFQFRPILKNSDNCHSIGNKIIYQAAKYLPKVIKLIKSKKYKKTQYSSKVRRFYRNKDFTENAIKKMNNNFKKLMLEKYLNNKSKIDKKFKINYHFI